MVIERVNGWTDRWTDKQTNGMDKNYIPLQHISYTWGIIKIQSKMKCYHADSIFPIICVTETKWQVTLMWIVWSDPKTNLSKILWLSSLPASLMKIWSKMKLLSSRHFLMSLRLSRAVTHANCGKWAKIKLVLSLLPALESASLTKIQSKMKSLSSRQHFPHYMSMGD